jgi:anhydro-N-acetylmuramic acid kinase
MNPSERLCRVIQKTERRIIGLMSGMSTDGVDLALVRISEARPGLKIQLLDAFFRPYPRELRRVLQKARSGTSKDICEANFVVGREFAECVNTFLRAYRISAESVDAIGSHGQTLVHLAPGHSRVASTLQAGFPSIIAELTGLITVGNFRVRDMVLGGQGAPLVPLVDYLLYASSERTIALNNLGSISNVTVVTPELQDVLAFDTGPANMPIDFFASVVSGNACGYDRDGVLSAQGTVLGDVLETLLHNPFFAQEPPKSAGYYEFGPEYLTAILGQFPGRSPLDMLRTAVEFTVETMAQAYEDFVLPKFPRLDRIVLTGGGARNPTLVSSFRRRIAPLQVEALCEDDGTFSDAKEALAFAVLANEVLSGRPTNVPGATGARRAVVAGEIAL